MISFLIGRSSHPGENRGGKFLGALSLLLMGAASAVAADFDIRQYGAACNGTTDDARAIQAALDAVPASGGTVLIPCRAAIGSSGVALRNKSNVIVRASATGAGFHLLSPTNQGVQGFSSVAFVVQYCTNCVIEGLTVEANNVNAAAVGFDRCTNTTLQNVIVNNTGFVSAAIVATANQGNRYLGNKVTKGAKTSTDGTRGMWIGNVGTQAELNPYIARNEIRDVGATGIALVAVAPQVVENFVENAAGAGVKFVGVPGAGGNSLFERNTLRLSYFSGLQLEDVYNTVVRGNTMEENQQAGIYIFKGFIDSEVSNNIVRNNRTNVSGGWQGGIMVGTATRSKIVGNQISDTRIGSSRTQDHAILISSAGISQLTISDNSCQNHTENGIHASNHFHYKGTITGLTITGNTCTSNNGYGLHIDQTLSNGIQNVSVGNNIFSPNGRGTIQSNVPLTEASTPTADTTAPVVSITTPASGATVKGSVQLAASATDNTGVAGVQFKVNGANAGAEVASSPYTTTWNSASVQNGEYTITAEVRDAAGNRATASIKVVVSNTIADTMPPALSGGAPTGTLAAGTTSATLRVVTNENATCRYSTIAGTAFSSMPNVFTTTGSTSHSTTVSSLAEGKTYTYFVRCQDPAGNATTSDYAISFTTPSGQASGLPVDGLVLWLKADAGITAAAGAVSRWADQSGNGNDAVQISATAQPKLDSASANGRAAVSFDGTSDMLRVANNPTLDLGSSSFTVSYWMQSPFTGGNNGQMRKGAGSFNLNGGGFEIRNQQTLFEFSRGIKAGTAQRATYYLPANTWINLAVVYDQAAGRATLYVDGTAVASAASAGTYPDIYDFELGRGNDGYLHGQLAEVLVYRKALSDTERQALRAYFGERYTGSDRTAPSVTVGSPISGATVSQRVTLSAAATDNIGVASVQFRVNGSPVGPVLTTAPYTTTWDTVALANGTYSITAIATDAAGNSTTSAAVSVSVQNMVLDTTPPVISCSKQTIVLTAAATTAPVSVTTNEAATCRYATTAGTAYGSMAGTFSTTGTTSHSTTVGDLAGKTAIYVRCRDGAGNANTTDFVVTVRTEAIPTGAVLWLRADMGVTATSGLISRWADQSGNGNHAVQTSASSQPQMVNSFVKGLPAIRFDGNNDLLSIPHSTSLNLGSGSFTVSYLVRSPMTSGNSGLVRKGGGTFNSNGRGWELRTQQRTLEFARGTGSGTAQRATAQLPADSWLHISVTYDAAAGSSALYVNGVLQAKATSQGVYSETFALELGRGNDGYLRGEVAELVVYRRALSSAEFLTLHTYLQGKYL